MDAAVGRSAVFNYLVGNCDNRLKNPSATHAESPIKLAPAYDVVCTTFFERFSRELGMRPGSARMIDDVAPSDFALLAKDPGIGVKRMRSICSDLMDGLRVPLTKAYLAAGRLGTAPLVAGEKLQTGVYPIEPSAPSGFPAK